VTATARATPIILDSETLVNEADVSKKNLQLYVFLLLAISIASFFPFFLEGVAADCRPNQIDGQCGLSTFLGVLYGGGTSILLLIVGGIVLTLVHFRKKNKIEEPSIEVNDNARN
jgi:hypothetical protein